MLSRLIQSLNPFTRRPQTMSKHTIDNATERTSRDAIYPVLLGLSEDDFVKLALQNGCGPFRGGDYGWNESVAIAQSAYRRGADDQLDACIRWLTTRAWCEPANNLLVDMRPSLKEKALAILEVCGLDPAQKNTIREALEALPE